MQFDDALPENLRRHPDGIECEQPSHCGVSAHRQFDAQRAAVASHGGTPVEFFDGCTRSIRRQPWESLKPQYQRKRCHTGTWTDCSPPTLSAYGTISGWEPRGFSNYDALQLSVEKRYSRGLFFLAAYTWSKSLDEGNGGNSSTGDPRINIQNQRNLRANYGLSSFDYRQRFTLSAIAELPFWPRTQVHA